MKSDVVKRKSISDIKSLPIRQHRHLLELDFLFFDECWRFKKEPFGSRRHGNRPERWSIFQQSSNRSFINRNSRNFYVDSSSQTSPVVSFRFHSRSSILRQWMGLERGRSNEWTSWRVNEWINTRVSVVMAERRFVKLKSFDGDLPIFNSMSDWKMGQVLWKEESRWTF